MCSGWYLEYKCPCHQPKKKPKHENYWSWAQRDVEESRHGPRFKATAALREAERIAEDRTQTAFFFFVTEVLVD